MTVHLDRSADEATACWLCHGCGERYPLDGPAYPVCNCGQRCRMVDAAGVPFVGSPADRLAAAQAAHAAAFLDWSLYVRWLREALDRESDRWLPGERAYFRHLTRLAPFVNCMAEHLDRVEAEVARMRGENP